MDAKYLKQFEGLNVNVQKFDTVFQIDYDFRVMSDFLRFQKADEVYYLCAKLNADSNCFLADRIDSDFNLNLETCLISTSTVIKRKKENNALFFDYNTYKKNLDLFCDENPELQFQANRLFKSNIERLLIVFNCKEEHLKSDEMKLKGMIKKINKMKSKN